MTNIVVDGLHIVTHSYVTLFSLKTIFYETNNIFYAKTTKNETKPMTDSESVSKIRSHWIFFKIFLCEQLHLFKKFCMERRLYNIFKSKNATKLAKPILESLYKFILGIILFVNLKRPVHLLWAVKFLTTFKFNI